MEIPSAYAILLHCRLLSGFSFINKRKQGTFYVSVTRELDYICCNLWKSGSSLLYIELLNVSDDVYMFFV